MVSAIPKFLLLSLFIYETSASRTPFRLCKQQPQRTCNGQYTRSRCGAQAAATRTMSTNQMQVLQFFSGGVAGTIASCITNPLEVVKTQLQSSSVIGSGSPSAVVKKIIATDGMKGFFRGLRPTLIGIIPARSAYFFAYEQSKRGLGPVLPEGSVGNAIIAGLAAGITSNTLTNPIWMVKTRRQLLADGATGQRTYSGYRDVINTILREEGVKGFYKGMSASYWGCIEGSIQFVIYEKIKKNLLKKQNESRALNGLEPADRLPKLAYFLSAAAAKGVAAVATYPHEVARTRMREQARDGVFKYAGMWQTLGVIANEEGRKGLYGGMGMHLIKVVPNSAIMFLSYEVVNAWLGQFQTTD